MVTAIAGHRFRASLPSLITVLAEHLGFVTRFGLDAGVWEGLPPRLLVDDRVVHCAERRHPSHPPAGRRAPLGHRRRRAVARGS
ncbi:DUF5994 family protein [Streptomyces sp. NPDC088353]|uniref:DUF5994 family protein n=1 Tax=Streptomyces sp. NPDC088353 TaxID=3365855 RepID=UPI0037F4DE1F